MKLDKRVAVVTGASKGIGRAMALALAEAGADVVVTARSGTALDGLAAEIADFGRESLVVVADLGARDSAANIAAAALDRFGRIDILVNNAAVIHPRIDLADFDPDLWREVIEVNLTATAMLTKAVLPSMIERGAGKIINISSLGGRRGGRGRSAYRATKAALINLTESVAAEVRRHGIDVTCICPGGVDTEGYRNAFASRGRAQTPTLMDPAEIAELAVFLASDASSAITGTAIDAFGGTNPLFRGR